MLEEDERWWYCERLKLKAKRPQCRIFLARPPISEAKGSYVDYTIYRPLPCEACKTGKRILRTMNRRTKQGGKQQ